MKKEMNNKGFSLVELIIVIAIMVILVAVLAPQYLRYVEKSRISTDTQTAVEFINAMQVAASDPDATIPTGGTYEVTSDSAGKITVSADLAGVIGKPPTYANGFSLWDDTAISSSKFQSAAFQTATPSITLTYNTTAKVWEVKTVGIDQSGNLPSSGTTTTPPAGSGS